MADKTVEEFTEHLVACSGEHIESILSYPHPFTEGGIIIVFRDETELTPTLLASIYEHRIRPLSLHVLRRPELFIFSLPGFFKLPGLFSENAHLAHWLKHKGSVLHGRDLREEVKAPPDASILLELHITASIHLARIYSVVHRLARGQYFDLIQDLDRQLRYLMATALLAHGRWDVSLETIPELFAQSYPDSHIQQTLEEFSLLLEVGAAGGDGARRAALEAAWLFECFLRRLKEFTR